MAAETSSPASYAARLSAMGGETRRSSFGAPKLSLGELEEEGGVIDKVLAFSQPSHIDMYNPFKVVTDPHDDHFQFEEDNAESIRRRPTRFRAAPGGRCVEGGRGAPADLEPHTSAMPVGS